MKDAADFYKRARAEMDKWGLTDWTFEWSDAKRCWGLCRYGPKIINVSKRLWRMNPDEESWDTLLHEIAHAKAGHEAGHGPVWKGWARRVGAKPERCYQESEHNVPKRKYKVVIKGTDRVIALYDKRPAWARRKNTARLRIRSTGQVVEAVLMLNM